MCLSTFSHQTASWHLKTTPGIDKTYLYECHIIQTDTRSSPHPSNPLLVYWWTGKSISFMKAEGLIIKVPLPSLWPKKDPPVKQNTESPFWLFASSCSEMLHFTNNPSLLSWPNKSPSAVKRNGFASVSAPHLGWYLATPPFYLHIWNTIYAWLYILTSLDTAVKSSITTIFNYFLPH